MGPHGSRLTGVSNHKTLPISEVRTPHLHAGQPLKGIPPTRVWSVLRNCDSYRGQKGKPLIALKGIYAVLNILCNLE